MREGPGSWGTLLKKVRPALSTGIPGKNGKRGDFPRKRWIPKGEPFKGWRLTGEKGN